MFFWFIKHKTQDLEFFFDRDGNLKICLLPGLEAQKVENHWATLQSIGTIKMFGEIW